MREAQGEGDGGSNKTDAVPEPLECLLVRVEPQKKSRCISCFGGMDGALVVARLEDGKDFSYLLGEHQCGMKT